jgi:hypothetical protein
MGMGSWIHLPEEYKDNKKGKRARAKSRETCPFQNRRWEEEEDQGKET